MAFKGKEGADYINARASALAGFYGATYNKLVKEIRANAGTLWQQDRARAMLIRADEAARQLNAVTKKFLNQQVPRTYFAFANETRKDIKRLNVAIPKEFSQIHYAAVEAMADNTYKKFGQGLVAMRESVGGYVAFAQQAAIRARVGQGMVGGESALQIAKEVEAMLDKKGITGLIDSRGAEWKLDTYAKTVTRQILANASRDGVKNTAVEFGFDLVKITRHGTPHEECAEWEDEIVSLTGETPGYPTLDEAKEAGLMHVGCRHGFYVIRPPR